jgi:heptosyltransferase II
LPDCKPGASLRYRVFFLKVADLFARQPGAWSSCVKPLVAMKLLLVQLSWLGDCVLTTPLINVLKTRYPTATITLLTTPVAQGLFEGSSLIDSVITYDKRGSEKGLRGLLRVAKIIRNQKFDRVFSVHRSGRTAVLLWCSGIPERVGFAASRLSFLYNKRMQRPSQEHEVVRNLAILGDVTKGDVSEGEQKSPLKLDLLPNVNPDTAGGKFLSQSTPFIVLFPSSSWFTKQWNGAGYAAVARYFTKRGFRVAVLGSKKEQLYNRTIMKEIGVEDLTGKTSLAETNLIVSQAALVVCNDSLALHLASAFLRPTVVVFCATSPSFGFGPWQNPYAEIVEMSGLSCKPCRRHGSTECPTGTNLCMIGVTSESVIQAAETQMASFKAQNG